MKYSIEYQQLHKGQKRPSDDGEIVGISFDSASGFALIPNVGDVVSVPEANGHCGVYGVVKSRLFTYLRYGDEVSCGINIVVEEADVDHGALIKE